MFAEQSRFDFRHERALISDEFISKNVSNPSDLVYQLDQN